MVWPRSLVPCGGRAPRVTLTFERLLHVSLGKPGWDGRWQVLTSKSCHASLIERKCPQLRASQVALVVKKLPASARDIRDVGLIPGSGRYPGGGHDIPLQYTCLENTMDRSAWQATVHGVAKSWTRLKQLSLLACLRYT